MVHDPAVSATLDRVLTDIADSRNYNEWLFSHARGLLGGRVLDAGAGSAECPRTARRRNRRRNGVARKRVRLSVRAPALRADLANRSLVLFAVSFGLTAWITLRAIAAS
jgi:hypothetical protein